MRQTDWVLSWGRVLELRYHPRPKCGWTVSLSVGNRQWLQVTHHYHYWRLIVGPVHITYGWYRDPGWRIGYRNQEDSHGRFDRHLGIGPCAVHFGWTDRWGFPMGRQGR